MKTLLTGFGAFGDVVDNPSARIAAYFAESGAPGHELTVRVLPVSFARASEEIERLLAEGGFDLALMMGVAGRESEIRVESCARNEDAARIPDCDGFQSGGPIAAAVPETYDTPVDTAGLVRALNEAGIPGRLSDNAGGYVCNRAYYAALHAIDRNALPTRCVFIHVPPDDLTIAETQAESGMALTDQIRAMEIILDHLPVDSIRATDSSYGRQFPGAAAGAV